MGVVQSVIKGFKEAPKLLKVVLAFFVFNLVMGLIALPFTGPDKVGNPQAAAITLVISLVSVLGFIFLQGGALGLIKDLLKGGAANFSDFVSNGKKYYVKILGLFLIILAVALVAIVVLSLISSGILAVATNAFTRALVAAIVIIASVALVILFLFPIYIIVTDDVGPIQAIKLGLSASLGNFWRALGLFLLLVLIAFVLALAIGAISALITGALPMNVGSVIMLTINSLLQSYLSIVMMIAFMAFYLGLANKTA